MGMFKGSAWDVTGGEERNPTFFNDELNEGWYTRTPKTTENNIYLKRVIKIKLNSYLLKFGLATDFLVVLNL